MIDGPGANDLTISGGGTSQIFVIDSGNVSISGLTFTGGLGSQGGAIANSGNLTITNCVFSNNVAQDNPSLDPNLDSAGGAIVNLKGATLVVTGTTFTGNKAIGVASSSNNANAYGGAIENVAGATFNGTNDTFYANSAVGGPGGGGFGGAIDNARHRDLRQLDHRGELDRQWIGNVAHAFRRRRHQQPGRRHVGDHQYDRVVQQGRQRPRQQRHGHRAGHRRPAGHQPGGGADHPDGDPVRRRRDDRRPA